MGQPKPTHLPATPLYLPTGKLPSFVHQCIEAYEKYLDIFLFFGARNTFLPIRCHVDVVLFCHEFNLLCIQAGESKHSNLLDNVTPVSRCTCQHGFATYLSGL